MDFTRKKYDELLQALISAGYNFQTFEEFIKSPKERSVVLRHDVDLLPYNSLKFAEIQARKGVKGVYYFRAVPKSWDEEVIGKIANLGHEIGYHYECLTTCNGDLKKGVADFEKNLSNLRKLVPVSTICMHGSPMSKYDSKDLWKKYDYKDYNLIGEPYFDINFNDVFYLTDTGMRWDGHKVSVRDKVQNVFNLSFHSTDEIIDALNKKVIPSKVMFNFHPQRWNDNKLKWFKEYSFQSVKNIIKQYLYVK